MFTEAERNYLQGQRLGRLVTLSRDGSPQARPVGFAVHEEFIEISGLALATTAKFRNIARHPTVSFLVDDLASVQPWHVRGVEIRGEAQALPAHDGTDAAIRIFPHALSAGDSPTAALSPAPSRRPYRSRHRLLSALRWRRIDVSDVAVVVSAAGR